MRYHTMVTKLWVQLTLEMADELILPYNLTRYAEKIAYDTEVFETNFNELFKPTGISLGKTEVWYKLAELEFEFFMFYIQT